MTIQNKQEDESKLRVGPLKSQLTLSIHSHFAITLWRGRKKKKKEDSDRVSRWMIPSVPLFLSRVSGIHDDALKGLLFAEMWLYRLEQALEQGMKSVQEQLRSVESQLSVLPEQIVISDITSSAPVNLEVYSRTPMGYRCVWLLVGIDRLALRVQQGYHYGLLSRQKRDKYLDNAGYQIRRVLGMSIAYRQLPITRDNLDLNSETYQQASRYLGEIDPDIISGKKRASFLPVLKK
ncbi:TPA: TIGR03761 family integrating conjugative element protein [Proteus mirabilis]|nr:TIGR03761 family integrating conjugative element protein [Proteus mirabilis]